MPNFSGLRHFFKKNKKGASNPVVIIIIIIILLLLLASQQDTILPPPHRPTTTPPTVLPVVPPSLPSPPSPPSPQPPSPSQDNEEPTASFSCDPSDCSTYAGSSDPALRLSNNSTDPDGIDDIATSSWDIGVGGHELVCSGLCDYSVQSPSLSSGEYEAKLIVMDKAGDSDDFKRTIVIKKDVIADFDCSLSEEGPWQDCSDFRGVQREYAYFKDVSTLSEGAGYIYFRIWRMNGKTFDSGVGENPVPVSGVELMKRFNTIELIAEDNLGRQDTVSYTFGARLPLPTWHEIAP